MAPYWCQLGYIHLGSVEAGASKMVSPHEGASARVDGGLAGLPSLHLSVK